MFLAEPRPINESLASELPSIGSLRAVMKSLAKDLSSRFSTASEFVDATNSSISGCGDAIASNARHHPSDCNLPSEGANQGS